MQPGNPNFDLRVSTSDACQRCGATAKKALMLRSLEKTSVIKLCNDCTTAAREMWTKFMERQ